jgi:hypothetical protein
MIIIKHLFEQKSFPNWFKSHPIFDTVHLAKKIFPSIGLPNCEKEIQLNNDLIVRKIATDLLNEICVSITSRLFSLTPFINTIKDDKRKELGIKCITLLNNIKDLLKNQNSFIELDNNGKIAIRLPHDISFNDELVFRSNQSFFKIYNKLNSLLRSGKFLALKRLEDYEEFRDFSRENVPVNKFKIVFSSDDINGAYDIATMSMRGISSCQNWNNGEYRYCTIGSMLDTFVGIIYLTSGTDFNNIGTKMIKRSVVRFVIDKEKNKPFIFIDKMYPVCDKKVLNEFKDFIKERTQFDVIYYNENLAFKNCYIPLNDMGKKIENYKYNQLITSYQDTRIENQSPKIDKKKELFEKNCERKLNELRNNIDEAICSSIIELNIIPKPLYVFRPIITTIIYLVINSIDKDQFHLSKLYIKRIYMKYFSSKYSIIEKNKKDLTNQYNSIYQLKAKDKLSQNDFVSLLKIIFQKSDIKLKQNFLRDLK